MSDSEADVSMQPWRGFASDNYAGVHPQILEALTRVNSGHQVAYGDDSITAELDERMAELFGRPVGIYPVFNGTGANVVALSSILNQWEAVVCTESAHIHMDEGGAPEKVAGIKLWTVPGVNGKLTPDLIRSAAHDFGFVHYAQPGAVSIAQSTEMGTVYTVEEVAAIGECARELGLRLHMDGARIANAAVSLGVPVADFTINAGVDILSFGGTKNGMLMGEVIVVFNPDVVRGVEYFRKSYMQLNSKMRFASAQMIALLSDNLWLSSAAHANAMAQKLKSAVEQIPGIAIEVPTDANAVFARLPAEVVERLQEKWRFYTWDSPTLARWMCAWDTQESDVDAFVAGIATEMAAR
ncbi:MAG: low specificity L-threonine aldolase [Actinomycetia bacterium]|nr:low specificity L-threonine aldolase [Actinomycetes bacterium]